MGWPKRELALEVFHGSESTLRGARTAFGRARVVVGVHGGGLANVVLCRPGTAVVELALTEPCFRDYATWLPPLGARLHPAIGPEPAQGEARRG